MDSTVKAVIETAQSGTFEGGLLVGTLANDGVGIAPLHDFEETVPEDLKAELAAIRAGIIDAPSRSPTNLG